jgi:hypothetical protein
MANADGRSTDKREVTEKQGAAYADTASTITEARRMLRMISRSAVAGAMLVLLASGAHAQSLRGSPATVDRVHQQAVNHGLRFFPSGSSIQTANRNGGLVRLGGNGDYKLVDVSYPYVIPAARTFVVRLATQYHDACGEPMVVTSAIRPSSMKLVNSVDESVHPTGMAVDLRRPKKTSCLRWLRNTLLSLESAGVLDVTEEHNPAHFHVAVFPTPYRRYVEARTGEPQVAMTTPPAARTTAVSPASNRTYTVKRGDSLWSIARNNQLTVRQLQVANDLGSSRIIAGQKLKIPAR